MVDRIFADAYLAAIYDAWHPRSLRDDFDFYLPMIMSARSVLDVGCGTGTLLTEARNRGHSGRLCGLDPAPGMLERARQRHGVEWVLGDFLSTRWSGEFDLVVMTGHAFQAVVADEDLEELLAAVRRVLALGGIFAFETRNPSARAWDAWRTENAVSVKGPDGQDVTITTSIEKQFDGNTISFSHVFAGAHAALPQVSSSTLRFLSETSLDALLRHAGLDVLERFGDFDGTPMRSDSPEIITIAQAIPN